MSTPMRHLTRNDLGQLTLTLAWFVAGVLKRVRSIRKR